MPYLFIPIQTGQRDPAGGAGAVSVGAHGAADGGYGGGRRGERGHTVVEVHDAAIRRLKGWHYNVWRQQKGSKFRKLCLVTQVFLGEVPGVQFNRHLEFWV